MTYLNDFCMQDICLMSCTTTKFIITIDYSKYYLCLNSTDTNLPLLPKNFGWKYRTWDRIISQLLLTVQYISGCDNSTFHQPFLKSRGWQGAFREPSGYGLQMKPPFSSSNILNGRRGGVLPQRDQGNWPEERKQLPSAARRPGQIHAVVAPIRGHDEAASAARVSHSIVVDSKTGWSERNETYWVHLPE